MTMAITVKVAFIAVASLIASMGGWTYALAQQLTQSNNLGTVETIIPAAALTGTSGALVWVVKQVVSGNLVHRDPAAAQELLADALKRTAEINERAMKREELLTEILMSQRNRKSDDASSS